MKQVVTDGAVVTTVGNSILHVKDLRKTAEWYAELLAMPLGSSDEESRVHVFEMSNGVNLILDNKRYDADKCPIFTMRTDDIERAYAFVKEAGIVVLSDIQRPQEGLACFSIQDSEGNAIRIDQDLRTNSATVVSENSGHPVKNCVQCACVPVENLKRATEWYCRLLGQPIKPERVDGGPIYWFDMDNGTGILLDDIREYEKIGKSPTLMLGANDIHEAYELLKNKGVEIAMDVQYDKYFMIKDIENNTVIICG